MRRKEIWKSPSPQCNQKKEGKMKPENDGAINFCASVVLEVI